jgi:hypothetical protein
MTPQFIQKQLDLLPNSPEAAKLREDYEFELIPYYCNYTQLSFQEILKMNNFIPRINRLLPKPQQITESSPQAVPPKQCCGQNMHTDSFSAFLQCQVCGATENLHGTILTNAQFYANGARKPTIYKHTNHCKKLLRCL